MLRSYVKGALSYVIPAARNSHSDLFPVSADFSYSQFLRHLVLRAFVDPPKYGEVVSEIGPGSSLGFGFAALISGAAEYRAVDVASHFESATNLQIFDALVDLFQRRADVPHQGEYVRIFPFLEDHAFPDAILTPAWMEAALAPERLKAIRDDVAAGGGAFVKFSLGLAGEPPTGEADWIASHSVLEHVDDLESMYLWMAGELKNGGALTHLIDFSSHGLTDAWNGHWAINKGAWTVLRGRRTYLINRQPLSAHLELMRRHGLAPVTRHLHRRVDGLLRASFAPEFQYISDLDASTHMAFLVCANTPLAK